MRVVSKRKLVYKFMEQPYVVQREIAHELGLVFDGQSFNDDFAFHKFFFQRLSELNKVEALKHRLFPDYAPTPDTHPCA